MADLRDDGRVKAFARYAVILLAPLVLAPALASAEPTPVAPTVTPVAPVAPPVSTPPPAQPSTPPAVVESSPPAGTYTPPREKTEPVKPAPPPIVAVSGGRVAPKVIAVAPVGSVATTPEPEPLPTLAPPAAEGGSQGLPAAAIFLVLLLVLFEIVAVARLFRRESPRVGAIVALGALASGVLVYAIV